MPKRTAEERIERYKKKLKKLEDEENERRKTILPVFFSTDEEEDNYEPVAVEEVIPPIPLHEVESEVFPGSQHVISPSDENPVPNLPEMPSGSETTPAVPSLDPLMLSALGEKTEDLAEFGEKIHENLAQLWVPLLKKGMPKEAKEKILKNYLVPDNCKLLQAPKLNPEISAAIPEMHRLRDKKLAFSQQQLGLGITAVNRAMNILLTSSSEDSKIQAIKYLSDACRVLSDRHYMDTKTRIRLITPNLDQSFLHLVQDQERDETLFGNNLPEKIKASKAIERQSAQIKKPNANKNKSSAPQSTVTRPPANQGNWAGPSRYPSNRGGRGGYKRTGPPAGPARRPQYPAQPRPTFNSTKPRAAPQQ